MGSACSSKSSTDVEVKQTVNPENSKATVSGVETAPSSSIQPEVSKGASDVHAQLAQLAPSIQEVTPPPSSDVVYDEVQERTQHEIEGSKAESEVVANTHQQGTRAPKTKATGRSIPVPFIDPTVDQASLELAEGYKCPPTVPAHMEVDVIFRLMAKSLCMSKPPDPIMFLTGLLQHVKDVTLNETSRYSSGVSKVNNKAHAFYSSDYIYTAPVEGFLEGLGGKYPYEVTKSVVSEAVNLWESVKILNQLDTFPDGTSAFKAFESSIKRSEARISVQQIYKVLTGISLERGDVLNSANELLFYAVDMFTRSNTEDTAKMTLGGEGLDHSRIMGMGELWAAFGDEAWLEKMVLDVGAVIIQPSGPEIDFSKILLIEEGIITRYQELMGLDPKDSSLRFIAYEALQAPPFPGWEFRNGNFSHKSYHTRKNPSHEIYSRIISRMKTDKIDLPMDMELDSVEEWFTLLKKYICADEEANLMYLNALDEWSRMKHTPTICDAKDLVFKCFAKVIGVDLRKAPLDIWIVVEGLSCKLPPEWTEVSNGGDFWFQHSAHEDYRFEHHPCLYDYKWIARHSVFFTKQNQEFKGQVYEKVEAIRKQLDGGTYKAEQVLREFDQLFQLVRIVRSLWNARLRVTREVRDTKAKAFIGRCFAEIEAIQDEYWKSKSSTSRIDKVLDTVSFVIRAMNVKHFREASPGFSLDDFTAIYLYTAEVTDLDDQIWFAMNKAMRENDENLITVFRPLISKLDKSLANLHGNTCTVYRGIKVRIDKENLYRVGNTIYWNAFSSSSKSTDVAKSFSFNEQTGSVGTLFIIHSISSRSISIFSAFPEEEEYLFPSNTLFEIVGVIPESHLQLLSCNSDIVSMREVRQSVERKFLTPHESILEKLLFSQKIQFVYEDFLMQFISPDARLTPNQVSKFALVPYMRDFATKVTDEGPRGLRTCVIGSPPGGGKSTLGIWVVSDVQKNNYMWNSKQGRTVIPFFISLPSLYGSIFDEFAIVETLQSQYQLSQGEMETLRDEFEVILLLDSLDEVSSTLFERADSHDLLKLNKLDEWNHLTVFITCREALLAQRPLRSMFDMKEDWSTVYIAPFAVDNIHAYINVHHRADFGRYSEILTHNTPVQELLTSPFLCWLIVPYLKSLDDRYSKKFGKLGRAECYEYALQERMKKNSQRLQKLIKDMSISITDEELVNDCTFFGECISSYLFCQGEAMTEVRHLRNASVEKQHFSVGMNTALATNPREVFRELVRAQISRSDSVNESSTFSFRHLSIMEFLVARALWQNTAVALPKLKHKVISAQSSIVVLEMFASLSEWYRNECGTFSLRRWEDVEADLYSFISRDPSGDCIISAAAFTLLCRSGCVSGGFERAQVSGALMAGAYLNRCNLTEANLRGVDLRDVCFEECQLDRVNLTDCVVDVSPALIHTKEEGELDEVRCATPSPDGLHIVSGTQSGLVAFWSKEGARECCVKAHSNIVTSVTYSHSGAHVISTSFDHSAKMWDTSGKLLHEFRHKSAIEAAAFSRDDQVVATGGQDRTARFWSAAAGVCHGVAELPHRVTQILLNHEEEFVFACEDGSVHMYNFKFEVARSLITDRCKDFYYRFNISYRYETDRRLSLVSYINNKLIVSATRHEGHLWSNFEYSKTLPLFKDQIKDPDYHASVSALATTATTIAIAASAMQYNTVSVFNITGELKFRLQEIISGLCFGPDGAALFGAGESGSIGMWDVSSGASLRTLSGHTKPVTSLKALPGPGTAGGLISTCKDGTVRMWAIGLSDRRSVAETNVSCVEVFPSGQYIITGNVIGHLKIWNINGFHVKTMKRHTETVMCIAVSPDGEHIVSASQTAILWKGNGEFKLSLKALTSKENVAVLRGVFTNDSSRLATAMSDGTVSVWSVAGMLLKTLQGSAAVVSLAFSLDGERLFTGSADGALVVYDAHGTQPWSFKGMMIAHMNFKFSMNPQPQILSNIRVMADGSGVTSSLIEETDKVNTSVVISNTDGIAQRLLAGPVWTDQVQTSQDSKYIATVHVTPCLLRVHDLTTKRGTQYHIPGVRDVQFTYDSKALLVACRTVVVVLSITGEVLQVLQGHSNTITFVTRPTAESFASISEDGTIRFWKFVNQKWRCCSIMPGPTTLSFVHTSAAGVQCSASLENYMNISTPVPRFTDTPIEGADTPAVESTDDYQMRRWMEALVKYKEKYGEDQSHMDEFMGEEMKDLQKAET